MARALDWIEIGDLFGIQKWPLVFSYSDTRYPGEQQMTFYSSGDLTFMNEKGRVSGRHAKWAILFVDSCQFRIEVRQFHCTGNWGVEQGYAQSLDFNCFLKPTEGGAVLECAAQGQYADRVSMVTHLSGQSLNRAAHYPPPPPKKFRSNN